MRSLLAELEEPRRGRRTKLSVRPTCTITDGRATGAARRAGGAACGDGITGLKRGFPALRPRPPPASCDHLKGYILSEGAHDRSFIFDCSCAFSRSGRRASPRVGRRRARPRAAPALAETAPLTLNFVCPHTRPRRPPALPSAAPPYRLISASLFSSKRHFLENVT
ncbi:hypothetical protein EVAR_19563_1 [Eumeta japonica]|uniref:Uncharacterized protein n=1 Tax=Eumeta variegata TaxID=151549 RepID=A0A4C1UF18_EUMVA|nr:hypothetical protein EVAR_19563_1 [Eumeta japonica]